MKVIKEFDFKQKSPNDLDLHESTGQNHAGIGLLKTLLNLIKVQAP